MPVISTVDTSSRPSSLPYVIVIFFHPSLHDIPLSLFACSLFLPFIPHQCHVPNRKRKENARLGNNKDKSENAASNTNATHVNPGPRQQSALDIVLAETGAQCRISIIEKTIKNHLAHAGVLHSQMIRPNRPSNRTKFNKPWTSMPSPYAEELRLPLFPGWSGLSPSE